jgi:primosomal protein N' (replication factor Y)
VDACHQFAHHSASTAGEILRTFVPSRVFSGDIAVLPATDKQKTHQKNVTLASPQTIKNELITLTKGSFCLFVCVPQIADAYVYRLPDRSSTKLFSRLTNTKLTNRLQTIAESKIDVVYGTPQFLSVIAGKIDQIALVGEGNNTYKGQHRPFADGRGFIRHAAATLQIPIHSFAYLLQPETFHAAKDRLQKPDKTDKEKPKTRLVDMKEIATEEKNKVNVFSSAVADQIRRAKDSETTLLFVARRGRRPFTVCNDCGETLACPECDLPLRLDESETDREFVCTTCGYQTTSAKTCMACGSWDLSALGIGLQFVKDILKNTVPDTPLKVVTGDTTDPKKAIEDFQNQESGLLLCTQAGVNWLSQPVDNTAIVTADSLLAVPDLGISTKIMRLGKKLQAFTKRSFIVQTRMAESRLLELLTENDKQKFYDYELGVRKQFMYSPFSTLVKLSMADKSVAKETEAKFADYDPKRYPARDQSGWHVLLSIPEDSWPDDNLYEQLLGLPLSLSINKDPKSLL